VYLVDFVDYRGRFYRLLHPRFTIVLATLCPNGRVNLMPASWNTPISEEPPTIGVVVYKEVYTYECLKYHPEATINVPSSAELDLTYRLGSVSGRDVDKVKVFNVNLIPSHSIRVPGMGNSLAIYETSVVKSIDIGEVAFYVFEVLRIRARKDVADEWGLNLDKTNVLLHGAGRVFYTVNPRKYVARGTR